MELNWHHVAMAVVNIERCKTFYKDLLGFEIDWENENYTNEQFAKAVGLENASAHVVMLRGHGTRLELFHYHSPEGERLPPKRQCDFGLTHFALVVNDIQSLYSKLILTGVTFNCPPQFTRPGTCLTYMKDPEGNIIELVEYK